jgi:hypothetical protein
LETGLGALAVIIDRFSIFRAVHALRDAGAVLFVAVNIHQRDTVLGGIVPAQQDLADCGRETV